ncbi:uncharacterized protein LOC112593272 [Melanaphis sacchari]|uniref:uncharacterized protein LOC112593272 n=1 Tax=Melanaphis sacchari TaxID=742174 RepID=UPI000DC14AE4|nr:uncharacterized protein LOC112593272 [Melanaphis sacchari]
MYKYQNYQLGTKEVEDYIKSLWDNDNNDFEQLSVSHNQRQNIPVWPTAIYPSNNYTSQFKLDQLNNSECTKMLTFNGHTKKPSLEIFSKQTIVNQLMVEPVLMWLNIKDLINYTWFFIELSIGEIEAINENNIDYFISKINKNSMTRAAKKKICFETKLLRDRKSTCQKLILFLDLEVTPNELWEYITCVHDILFSPIPNKNCMIDDKLQEDIILIMQKLLYQLYDKISGKGKYFIHSQFGMSINKYLRCTFLISMNEAFTNNQVEKTIIFAEMLKNKVYGNIGQYNA